MKDMNTLRWIVLNFRPFRRYHI